MVSTLVVTGVRGEPVEIPLVSVPAGRFLMGFDDGLPFAPEGPVHEVTIRSPFRIATHPVTQHAWELLTGTNPSHFSGDGSRPVECVSWDDAVAFCERLSARTGQRVRLPSEAEWEYAYRAGTVGSTFAGDDLSALHAHAWFEENSGGTTHPVGEKAPNPWGIRDIAGNVWEWCADVWHGSYEGAPCDGSAWTEGAQEQGRRCVRGGAWDMDRFRLRASYRSFDWRDAATSRLGLRIVACGG